ncbi:MAG: YtxH domain-containing protein [Marinirhabdus sp.]|nr:YtxH domain-containing protein [Marinirhabdus sp.]
MKSRQRNAGLIALLSAGVAGGLAYWKYRTMSPQEKAKLKSKINNVGDSIKETANGVEKSISDKYAELKQSVS